MTRKTALLIAIPTLFGLSCCCGAFALPFGAAGVWSWADSGIAVPTAPGTASVSLRASTWYLGPGEPTYDVLVRRSRGEDVGYQRFSAHDVHDRLGIQGLSPEGSYEFTVRLPDGRGGHYDPGVLQFLSLRADETTDVIVVVHGGIDLGGVVISAIDGAVLADVDVQPEAFTYTRDGMTYAMVFGRTNAAGEFAIGGICGSAPGADGQERSVVFRRAGFRERRVPLAFPSRCDRVLPLSWHVPLEPLASTTIALSAELTFVRIDPGSPAERAGLRAFDRIVSAGGVRDPALMPSAQEVVESFDTRDEEIWLTVVGGDGAEREVRTVLREPPVGG